MKKILCTRDVSVKIKISQAKCYRFLIFLYEMESWATNLNRLQAFKMWAYRRVLRVSWREQITQIY